jgi:hypothetical protein
MKSYNFGVKVKQVKIVVVDLLFAIGNYYLYIAIY